MDSCKLCGSDKPLCLIDPDNDFLLLVQCPRCGKYNITNGALSTEPDPFIKERLHLISAVARRNSERDNPLHITEELLVDRPEFEARILSMCPQNTRERMDCILTYVADKSSYPGQLITIDSKHDYPLFYCKQINELRFYLDHLDRNLLLAEHKGDDIYELLLFAAGWQRVEELAKPNIESTQAFVAMWFGDSLNSAYSEGIAKLEEDTGFTMLRIDMKQFNDKICDRILAEIKRSRFLIADVTGQRQGVYFEAGFAMGMGLPVIWTCREDQIKECHFDTRQYNHIIWNNEKELRQKLRDRILATIGRTV